MTNIPQEKGPAEKRSYNCPDSKELTQIFDNFQKPVDYLCILDFEATCCHGKQPKPQEIIEFPTLLMNVKTGEIEREFHFYIKPDVHPTLSEFCTELTGITQEIIDEKGLPLTESLKLHRKWIDDCGIVPWHLCRGEEDKTFLYLTCGDWDLNQCLPRQLKYHGQSPDACFKAWINIKKVFWSMYTMKCKGMLHMLDHFGMKLKGRHHSGIDDCRNIARVCKQMIKDGWQPMAPTKIADYYE